jgi:hypothetical protein
MKRDAAQTIWRTVVFAGAMLGAPACSKPKPAATTPPTTTAKPDPAKPDPTATTKPDGTDPATPNPCGDDGRPRGADDEGGGTGRGFILS